MGEAIAAQVAGTVIGGALGNRSANRRMAAIERMNQQNNQGFEMAKPYIDRLYREGAEALDDQLDTGYYQGATYAGLNDNQRRAANMLSDFGFSNAGMGSNLMDTARNFGQNYADAYNLSTAGGLNSAIDYATNNAQPLVDAALRDSRNRLNEVTLPGINQAASATGNANSSRAGVAEAIARRDQNALEADVTADIQDRLLSRSLNQYNQDITNRLATNDALKNIFGIGFELTPSALGQVAAGEGVLQRNAQNELDASREFFEGNRDFRYNALNNFGSGILGQAPRSPSGYQGNFVDPLMATASGALGGFGLGGSLGDLFGKSSPAVQRMAVPMPRPTYMGI